MKKDQNIQALEAENTQLQCEMVKLKERVKDAEEKNKFYLAE